jgi:hypothetical protein
VQKEQNTDAWKEQNKECRKKARIRKYENGKEMLKENRKRQKVGSVERRKETTQE